MVDGKNYVGTIVGDDEVVATATGDGDGVIAAEVANASKAGGCNDVGEVKEAACGVCVEVGWR